MQEKCECSKKTIRDDEQKQKLINRLKRIEGQVRAVQAMIENDAYCYDVLMQSSAINAAISSFNKEFLTKHIQGCVVNGIKEGDEQIVDELVDAIKKFIK